jgi:hypothetical protein
VHSTEASVHFVAPYVMCFQLMYREESINDQHATDIRYYKKACLSTWHLFTFTLF